ncbi:uncharacterized protein CTRU02_203451 [Colletotrichum truncatum]|uniref:Uncharacterized protein n=1 Tax=Colletotrichum truncatum TaxID=5467 RepID=A0ACC3Z9A0_COLTU|nr:uncharacterized protein CTRU02_05834 [Colletotrichum truncatum]KAF6793579.1 hypothetical protein CTRU02_05834 [Colletotrichum truncatum]
MRPFAFLVAALTVAPGVLAVDQMKSVIIWTDKTSITDAMIDSAKQAILDAGGQITHTYSMTELFRGFAAVTPVKVLESVKALGGEGMNVDEDQIVSG